MTTGERTRQRVSIGDITCDAVDYQEAVDQIDDYVRSGRPHLVLTPNIAQVRQASRMPDVAAAYRSASMSTPDGWPIAAALRVLAGRRHQGRVTGSDLTPLLCLGEYRVGLIGGRGDSAMRAAERLQQRNPALSIGLVEPAEPAELADPVRRAALIARIAAADLDLIFLGVGVPKQERLALELLQQLDRGVVLCVGATIDFLAGAVRRSPAWVQRAGLEWAYRIAVEPRRMVARYASALPFFVWQVGRAALRHGAARPAGAR
jgi:N-acetylglucosaminyldiphosphoundecaprenol N-acetyl-beta-D-mannosaminyltransferase